MTEEYFGDSRNPAVYFEEVVKVDFLLIKTQRRKRASGGFEIMFKYQVIIRVDKRWI